MLQVCHYTSELDTPDGDEVGIYVHGLQSYSYQCNGDAEAIFMKQWNDVRLPLKLVLPEVTGGPSQPLSIRTIVPLTVYLEMIPANWTT
jgi:hypothetical protein